MWRFGKPVVGVLLFLLWFLGGGVVGAAEYVKYKDPKQPVGVRIRDLMKRMSLAEKIGQMTQIERHVASPDVIKKYLIGMYADFIEKENLYLKALFRTVKVNIFVIYCIVGVRRMHLFGIMKGFGCGRECVEWGRECTCA